MIHRSGIVSRLIQYFLLRIWTYRQLSGDGYGFWVVGFRLRDPTISEFSSSCSRCPMTGVVAWHQPALLYSSLDIDLGSLSIRLRANGLGFVSVVSYQTCSLAIDVSPTPASFGGWRGSSPTFRRLPPLMVGERSRLGLGSLTAPLAAPLPLPCFDTWIVSP